ncbi:helix-turn-helix domain-containing protein [Mycolicibacterium goodii]|uniref:helix-turn-helix domain-containing protein n=1 Tax=Mycolicibacterium goodii TaxID=134601 RepID=UPI0013046329|nr:helix-turn-helix domain-containing protein [Mycolicibacterium goodii]
MNLSRSVPSLEVRIAERITADGSAIIPPRIARWVNEQIGMTADRRIRLRGTDPDAYIALTALHLSALRSDNGTNNTGAQPVTQELNTWMSTGEAAKALNVTDRCIRKWCTTGRLHAELIGGRWLVNPNSIALIAWPEGEMI